MPFIYALCEPTTMAVRYVGKANSIASRLKSHRNEKRSTRKCRWIAALKRDGLEPEVRILEDVDQASWEEAERRWIARLRADGCDLTNHTDGGDGVAGLDAEARARLSAAMKTRMADPGSRARVFTPERSAKISMTLKGMKKTAEHVAKLPQNRPGRRLTDEHRAKIKANNRGHRWSVDEIAVVASQNRGNRYTAGNQFTKGRVMPEHEKLARSIASKGRAKSREHIEKIRRGLLAAWAKKRSASGLEKTS